MVDFDWADLAFASKKTLNDLKATFIFAPRELSTERFKQLVKTYLPQGNIVLGLAKEPYVDGFDGQVQFRTLRRQTVQPIIDKVNQSGAKHRMYTLSYFQREAPYILDKLQFRRVVLVNGSWHKSFHTRPEYYALVNKGVSYTMESPFVDENEAKFAAGFLEIISNDPPNSIYSAKQMMRHAAQVGTQSFDHTFQTGVALGKRTPTGYKLLARVCNQVIPYPTYAMHFGASRETHFSPPNDLNHYDTIHAEMALIVKAGKQGINLKGTSLFINLLPCPTCARILSQTDISDFYYTQDHSDGYAIKMLQLAGKNIERIV